MNINTLIQSFCIIFSLFFLSACSDDISAESQADSEANETAVSHATKHLNVRYICPMHPKIVKSEAGNCPICGMDLVKKETPKEPAVKHAQKHLDTHYVCPMHPKIVKNKARNCPICGMDLVKNETPKEPAVEHAKKHLDAHFVCPMHPQIIKNKAGSCPICGMHLVKKKSEISKAKYPLVKLTTDIVQKLGVRTAKVKKGQLAKKIKTVGYVQYNERRHKSIKVGTDGWVENLSMRRVGLPVKKGQLLLELYSPEFLHVQKQFIEAQKKDKSGILKKYGERQESVGPREQLRYMHVPESMMNEIARKGKPKFRLPIYSPMHGKVVELNIHKHKYVEDDEILMVIADLSTVWVEANVYEHQLEWLKPFLETEIEVRALPGKRFKGQVSYIYPELDAKTRTLKVRLLIPNPDGLLKPNMFAQVSIYASAKKNLLKIPREALIVTGERESVILDIGDGKFQPVDVVSGLQSQGEVEILSGLKQGDTVVASGQFLIDSEANLQASFSRLNAAQSSE